MQKFLKKIKNRIMHLGDSRWFKPLKFLSSHIPPTPLFERGKRKAALLKGAIVAVILLSLGAGIFFYHSKQSSAAWYNSSWQYRKKLTFNNASYGALTNQPISIELTSANFDFGKARADGYDIVFTDSDGTTLLTYTRETFSAASESARFWVKVPAIDANVNTDFIYMYYGNASAGNTSSAFANSFFSGAAGYWGMEDGDRSAVTDTVAESVADEDMLAITPTGTIDSATGARGNALTFNGTDEYLTQKVWDTKQGTVTASMVADTAFINDEGSPGQDFSPYVGASGSSKPYMLVATDSTGLKAWGYIGEQGTGETLGGELVTNGDFSSWTGDNPDGWALDYSENAGNYVTQNPSGQCQMVSDGTAFNITQNILASGKLYKYYIDVKAVTGTTVFQFGASSYFTLTSGIKNGYRTSDDTFLRVARLSATNITFDDVTLKQVLTPTTNGVKIYSTKTGSTQSWAGKETNFNANAVSSYEIRKTDFQITGAMTVGAWVKPNDTANNILFGFSSSNHYPSFSLQHYDGGRPLIYLGGGNYRYFKSSAWDILKNGNWHFVSFVLAGINQDDISNSKMYVDGQSIDNDGTSYASGISQSNEFFIGRGLNFHFNGSIDEPIILPSALTADQIGAYYNNTKASQSYVSFGDQSTRGEVESGSAGLLPLAHWKFNEGQGATAQDATANNNDGTITGAGYWTSEENCVQGKCVYLDGTNDWVSRAYDGDFNFGTSPFTVSGWFKADLVSATKIIAARYSSGGWKMYLNSSGNVCFGIDDDASFDPDDYACSSARYDDNEWHFVSAYRDISAIYVYVDATSAGSDAVLDADETLSGSSPALYLGIDSDGESNKFTGYLDDFKIYPYARSATQIAEDYNAPGLPRGAATKGVSFSSGSVFSGYKYRKKLTFANTSYGALTNQPVSVVLSSSNFDFTKTRSDGYDIIFTDSNGTTLLNFNREAYSAGSESARFWVKVPQIDAASATDYIYMYYGNGSASDRSVAFSNAFFSGAAGYWGMEDGDRSAVTDTVAESVADEDMLAITPTGTIDSATGVRGNALTFNGTDEYLTQKVHMQKSAAGTVTAAMNDWNGTSGAFINDDGHTSQEWAAYAGASGSSKPYMIVVTDSTGLKAWGYIGEQGTGETLGSDLVSGWTNSESNPYETLTAGAGNLIAQAINSSGIGIAYSEISSVNLALYKCINSFTYVQGNVSYVSLATDLGGSNLIPFTVDTTSYKTIINNQNNFVLLSYPNPANWSLDNFSLRQVLTPTTSGVKIYSTKTGSTQSWANVESGFNANSITSYEIRKTDFQITGALTVGAWVKTSNTNDWSGIINKFNSTSGFKMGVSTSGHLRADFRKDADNYFSVTNDNINVEDGSWHLVVTIYNESTATIYADGVAGDPAGSSGYNTDGKTTLILGNDTDTAGRYFNGSIDEPIILPSALTADQIGAYYNNTKASQDYVGFGVEVDLEGGDGIEGAVGGVDLTTGLMGEWKLDEKSGTSAADSSGNGNTGTLTNGPVWVGGKTGGGVQMDGVDDYVGVGDF